MTETKKEFEKLKTYHLEKKKIAAIILKATEEAMLDLREQMLTDGPTEAGMAEAWDMMATFFKTITSAVEEIHSLYDKQEEIILYVIKTSEANRAREKNGSTER